MRVLLRLLVLVATASLLVLAENAPVPHLNSVDPDTGKAGDVLTTTGENLDAKFVKELYLTTGNKDIKVEITEQTSGNIKFKIPAKAAPGRYSLMLLTAEAAPKYLEEPVKCTVEQ